VLADAKKRETYDRGGEDAIKGGGHGGDFHNPMDIFDMFFGGGSRGVVFFVLIVFVLYFVYPLLPVSLECPFLIAPSVSIMFIYMH
jgi:uncharacterized membrane protein